MWPLATSYQCPIGHPEDTTMHALDTPSVSAYDELAISRSPGLQKLEDILNSALSPLHDQLRIDKPADGGEGYTLSVRFSGVLQFPVAAGSHACLCGNRKEVLDILGKELGTDPVVQAQACKHIMLGGLPQAELDRVVTERLKQLLNKRLITIVDMDGPPQLLGVRP